MQALEKLRSSDGRPCPLRACRVVGLAVLAVVLTGTLAAAGLELEPFEYSSDITLSLGIAPLVVADEEIAVEDDLGAVAIRPVGPVPEETDIIGYAQTPDGEAFLAFDTSVSLAGELDTVPGDVVRYDGLNYTLEFDGGANGLPPGTRVDAIAIAQGDLLLSFDVTVSLPGSVVADDEDLVLFDGGAFSLFFDASAAGVPSELDLDGAHFEDATENLLLSFDGSGKVGEVVFDDEDVLEYARVGDTWSLRFNGSARNRIWRVADLDALDGMPTPGPSTTTTTTMIIATTTTSTTSTTMPPSGSCGVPNNDRPTPLASDCLFVLQAAIGARECPTFCLCDVNADERLVASDALFCLQAAVGDLSKLNCVCDEK